MGKDYGNDCETEPLYENTQISNKSAIIILPTNPHAMATRRLNKNINSQGPTLSLKITCISFMKN